MENQCILNKLRAWSLQQPDKVVIYHKTGVMTYKQLYQQSFAIMQSIMSNQDIHMVGLKLSRTPNLIAAIIACLGAGKTYIPIDPKHPEKRINHIIRHVRPSLVLDDINIANHIINQTECVLSENIHNEIAYILFTSGSTGQPKGIEVRRSSVYALLSWAKEYYSKEVLDCIFAGTTITFDLSVFEILLPIWVGSSIYLGESLLELLKPCEHHHKISLINTVPTAIRSLIAEKALPKNIKVVNLAGEVLTWDLVHQLYQCPQVQAVYNLWGPSEDTTYSSVFKCPRYEILDNGKQPGVPIGKAITREQLWVLDENLNKVDVNQIGEICISGAGIAKGYYNNTQLTQSKFIKTDKLTMKPLRVYRTGDLGYVDCNGNLHFKGRIDRQVKVNGFRVELEELEKALENLPKVMESCATVVQSNGQSELVAGIFASDHSGNRAEFEHEMKRQLEQTLPTYMIPTFIYISSKKFDKTPNGKICRKGFHDIVSKKMWDEGNSRISFSEIVKQVIDCDFDPSVSFKSIAGNSITALRLIYKLNKYYSHNITLKDLLINNTPICDLEQRVTKLQSKTQTGVKDCINRFERRMWSAYQSARHKSCLNVSLQVTIYGDIALQRFQSAIISVLNHCRVLNVNYITCQSDVHKIENVEPIIVQVFGSDVYCQQINHEVFDKPFDLGKDKLVRVAIKQLDARKTNLYLCFPHVVIDGISLEWLFDAISNVYKSGVINDDIISNTVYIQSASKERLEQSVNYFQRQFANINTFPAWIHSPYQLEKHSVKHTTEFSHSELLHFSKACRQMNITEPFLFLYLFSLVLNKLKIAQDPIIGIPLSNRGSVESSKYVGNLVNTLPFISSINMNITVKEDILYLFSEYVELISYEDACFTDIVDKINIPQKNKELLFDCIFSYIDFADNLQLSNCKVTRKFYAQKYSKAKIVLSVIKNKDDNTLVQFEADSRFMTPDLLYSLHALMKHFITTAVEMLDQKIKDICCVPPEQRSIIKDNLIRSKYDALQFNTTSLITQIELIAQKCPDHICVVDDGMNFNYYEIIQYAKSVAAFIIKNNIERQNAVGIKVKRSWRLIPIILGILYSGCYYVPLDPRNPSKRTASIASNAKMKLIIDDECFDIIIKRAATSSDYFRSTGLEALIYCIFTSGTTGEPKGVPITNQNVLSLFKACETWVKFSENDIWGLFHSYAFDFSVWEIFGALLYGGKLVIFNEEQCANPIDCMNLIQKEGVTIFNQTPSSFKNLLSCNVSWSQSIRYVFFGGEALQPSDLISWWDNYGANFKTQLVNMYGITETTIHAAYHLVDCHFNSSNIGRPLSDQGMVIVDSCNRPCAIGVPGELWLSGEGLTNGYLNDDSMTTAKFNEDSFWGLNDRFYHSGDMAMLNMHGEFIYLGRKDKQIKINGHRLESEEVIYYLKNITGVIDACIQVVSHNDFGVQTLFAYYVAENNISDMMISGKLAEHLPAYAIPTYYIRIDKIPLTVNGKIDISSLPTAIDNSKHIHQQTTSIDQSIADAWKEVLGCKIIATDKSFFELGGNSIKAMLLVKKINMLLNKTTKKNSFSIVDMFKYTTIEKQISAARKWL